MNSTFDEILRLAATLTSQELSELRKRLLAPQDPKPTAARSHILSGYRFQRTSSRDCSMSQRAVFLGSGGSKLCRLPECLQVSTGLYDQFCITKDSAVILSNSRNLPCKASGSLEAFPDVVSCVDPLGFTKPCEEFLPRLNRDFRSRSHEKYMHIPVAESGRLLLEPPYYPKQQEAPYHLDALPWQRYLYTLSISWYTEFQVVLSKKKPWLVCRDDYHMAFLPLQQS